MGTPDRDTPACFEERQADMALKVTDAMTTHDDARIQQAWTGGSADKTVTSLQDTTKKAVVTGASFALAAENLAELRDKARSYAQNARPHVERGREASRRTLVENYRGQLLALTDSSGEDQIAAVLNEFLTEEELLPHRHTIGIAIAQLHLACSGIETTKVADRMIGIEPLTRVAIDATLRKLRPNQAPLRPRRQRPTATTATPTRDRPSLRNHPW